MTLNPFVDSQRRLRQGWWVLIFFLVLGAILVPLLVITRREGTQVSVPEQAVVVAAASLICQLLRRRPIAELIGPLDRRWPQQFLLGVVVGAALMFLPALFLGATGCVAWQRTATDYDALWGAVVLFAAVAVAEELVFRGFVFQRLIDGLGIWPAQILLGAYFVLTHAAALPTAGATRYLAIVNIATASLLFGFAFIRTRSLALPLGMHFAANVTQGSILGFGVSGSAQAGLLNPVPLACPDWMSGGPFGLEASLPGLVTVVAAALVMFRSPRG